MAAGMCLSVCAHCPARLQKTDVFWIFYRFLGFLNSLGFNVHNAEHRYMTHDK